jgi:hypothetical protein
MEFLGDGDVKLEREEAIIWYSATDEWWTVEYRMGGGSYSFINDCRTFKEALGAAITLGQGFTIWLLTPDTAEFIKIESEAEQVYLALKYD